MTLTFDQLNSISTRVNIPIIAFQLLCFYVDNVCRYTKLVSFRSNLPVTLTLTHAPDIWLRQWHLKRLSMLLSSRIRFLLICCIMAAILDLSRKRGFPMGGFGWGICCGLRYHQWTHFRWERLVNIFVQPKSFFAGTIITTYLVLHYPHSISHVSMLEHLQRIWHMMLCRRSLFAIFPHSCLHLN